MFNQRSKTSLVFALLIALLMGWGSHATSWLISPAQHSFRNHDHHHVHAVKQVSSCALCELQHVHSLGEHIHETPHLTLLLSLSAQPERSDVPAWPHPALPESPVSRIERPPRT